MKKILAALLIVACALTATFVYAAIQTFSGNGKYIMSDFETEFVARQRAIQRAKEDAQDKAGVYLASFSQSVNARLTADEISAVTNNIINVSDVQVDSDIADANGEPVTVWTATLKASIDTDGIFDWLRRDDNDKITIIQQNNEFRDALERNDAWITDLKEQYKRATSQAERDKIREQLNDADRDFLAYEKNNEGVSLYYAKDYYGAIKLYSETIELNPNHVLAYNNRGAAYSDLGQYEQALADYNKAVELRPNYAAAYNNRGVTYYKLGRDERAIADYTKAIQLDPTWRFPYNNRGNSYQRLKQYEQAIRDYDKAIQLNPNYFEAYNNRGKAYYDLKQYERAIQDYTKSIELNNPDPALVYNNRGNSYLGVVGKFR